MERLSAIGECTFYIATYLAGEYEIVNTRSLSSTMADTVNLSRNTTPHRVVKVKLVEVKENENR